MKTLYLDLISGISGDMFIGALLDLGVDLHRLEHELEKLHLEGYHLHSKRAQKSSISGIKFDVHLAHEHDHAHGEEDHGHNHDHEHEHAHEHGHSHPHGHEHGHAHGHPHPHTHAEEPVHGHEEHEHGRSYAEIRQMIQQSDLSPWVKEKAAAVFARVAIAEGRIHGVTADEVHFHEVGAIDSIVDIVGACIALEMLGKPRVLASPVVEGTGFIKCAHGYFPIPAPATLAILGERGIKLTQCTEPHELITPTGAALLAEFVEKFGPMEDLAARHIGFGLGTRDNKTRPNVLRVIYSDAAEDRPSHDWETDRVALLETNLDDVTGEVLGNCMERALKAGALDVFHTPIQMKKNRPGTLLSVLCSEADADRLTVLLLTETSAFGVRRQTWERRKLNRHFGQVQTSFGPVTVKYGTLDGRCVQAAPEYESVKEAAEKAQAAFKDVYLAALQQVRGVV